MSSLVYSKDFIGCDIENFDPMDILNNDIVVVDDFGDPNGIFHIEVTFTPFEEPKEFWEE